MHWKHNKMHVMLYECRTNMIKNKKKFHLYYDQIERGNEEKCFESSSFGPFNLTSYPEIYKSKACLFSFFAILVKDCFSKIKKKAFMLIQSQHFFHLYIELQCIPSHSCCCSISASRLTYPPAPSRHISERLLQLAIFSVEKPTDSNEGFFLTK